MTLQASGPISISDIAVELGLSPTSTLDLNSAQCRTLAEVPSGTITLNDFYGKSDIPPITNQAYSVSGGAVFFEDEESYDWQKIERDSGTPAHATIDLAFDGYGDHPISVNDAILEYENHNANSAWTTLGPVGSSATIPFNESFTQMKLRVSATDDGVTEWNDGGWIGEGWIVTISNPVALYNQTIPYINNATTIGSIMDTRP